ncbi:MFS general substrate transporter [Xylariaceae sp. FL0255]|nr:MFS general substrate transporter [Xylariaceae sp. FL0255]
MSNTIKDVDTGSANHAEVESNSNSKHVNVVGGIGMGTERVILTEEDDKRIRRKTDKHILSILIVVYFLQILDKTTLGYAATFGLQKDTGLVGNQYSLVSSIGYIAQLGWQPFSSFLIVKVPHRILMPSLLLGWGIAEASLAAANNFRDLLVSRFFLGLFEAGCLPLFSVITSQWYRRNEQPMRVAWWYGTNGWGTIVDAALSYGLGHINNTHFESWRIIFLFVGLLTIATAPFVYWFLDNDIPSCRFLSEEDKAKAIERLRANQTGVGTRKFKWDQIAELALDPKTYGWLVLSFLINAGAGVANVFGPLILNGIGFDKYTTSLLNIPYGFILWGVAMLASWICWRTKTKWYVLGGLIIPVIAGLAVLYAVPRSGHTGALIVGYYLIAFLYGCTPVQLSWMISNTAGTTKKSAIMSVYNAASSAGNIAGPLLFNAKDAPEYLPGLRIILGFFIAVLGVVIIQAFGLAFLNKMQERRRVRNGKPAKIVDTSMDDKYHDFEEAAAGDVLVGGAEGTAEGVEAAEQGVVAGVGHAHIGDNAFADLTDRQNDEFVYIL